MRYQDLLAEQQKAKEEKQNKLYGITPSIQNVADTTPQPEKSKNMLAYMGERMGAGLLGAGEGLYDFAVGGIADIFGYDDYAKSLHANDITGRYQQSIEDRYDAGKVAYAIGTVLQTTANMLPSVALSAATAGTAGLALMGAQASGRGITEAYHKTGELGAKEYGYGMLSGASEIAVEKLSGGIGGLGAKFGGKGALDGISKRLIKNTIVRGMVGEGMEEVVQEFVDPYLRRATFDPEAENANFEDYVKAFALGAASSGLLQGGQNTLRNITVNRKTGDKIIQSDKTKEIVAKAIKLKNTDSQNLAKTIDKRIKEGKEITPIAIGKLANQYNADLAEINIKDIQKTEKISKKQAERLYIESLIAEKSDIDVFLNYDNDVERETQVGIVNKAVAENNLSRQTVRQIADFAKSTKADIRYIDADSNIEGYTQNGKIYINVNQGDVAYKTAVHEQLHNLERNNPAEYKQVKEAVLGLSKSIPEIQSRIKEIQSVYKNAIVEGKPLNLTDTQIEAEVVAKVATDLIENPNKLNQAIKTNKTFVERIADFLNRLIKRGKGLFNATDQKKLEQAYNTLTDALKADAAVSAKNAQSKGDAKFSLTDTKAKVLTKMPESSRLNVREKIKEAYTKLQIAFTNEWAGVEKVGKELGINDIDVKVQKIRSSRSASQEMINGNQFNYYDKKVGKGLVRILQPVYNKGEQFKQNYFAYLLHTHNVDRLNYAETKYNNLYGENAYAEKMQAIEEKLQKSKDKLKKIKNKDSKVYQDTLNRIDKASSELEQHKYYNAVFYNSVAESQQIANQLKAELEKELPNLEQITKELYDYQNNLLQLQVDSGSISKRTADTLREIYPHYVPTNRDTTTNIGTGAVKGKYNLEIKQTIKKAKGGNQPILPIDIMIAKNTMQVMASTRTRELASSIYKNAKETGNFQDIEVTKTQKIIKDELNDMDYEQIQPKNNEITFFDGDKMVTMKVSKRVFAGFESLSSNTSWITDNIAYQGLRKVNSLFKQLVTSYNPAFMVRNAARDIQDAGINSNNYAALLKNYPKALQEIKSNGQMWQLYRAKGGLMSSLFDINSGGFKGLQNAYGLTKVEGNLLNRTLQSVENINIVIEQAPRLAEFMASMEKGNTADQAILDATDVTVNFGRTGKITKVLNSSLMPFLNPAIQGASKLIRNVTSAKASRTIIRLICKCVVLGIAPQVLQAMMYAGDDDYKNLRDFDKENNYLFKVGDKFIKIPKGRLVAVLAGATLRTGATLQGEKDAWDGYLSNVSQQISPVENFSRTILSPFKDISTNTTWYGGAIEGREFEYKEPRKRYDESTSSIAKAIGNVINYSPKKIHYLIDQYSGVVGDFILPATTKRAEKGFFESNFTVDPTLQNKYSKKFYNLYDEAQYAKSNGDETAELQVRHLNKVKSAISALYAEKDKIENSDLSNKEKVAQTKAVQVLINQAYNSAITDYELITNAFNATQSIEDKNIQYIESVRLLYGSERALRDYNANVYEKAKLINEAGISYDKYYNLYFSLKGIESDKDKYGNTIAGSKKTKVLKQIAQLNITTDKKLLLIMASGYTVQDGELRGISSQEAKRRVAKYIASLSISKDEKVALAEQCGLTVRNGRVILTYS